MRNPKFFDADWRSGYADRRMAEFSARCRERGLAVTPQRIAIIRALLEADDHPRAEEICAEVRKQHPHISLATVHRTLETLCEIGEARKVTPLYDSARYDGNVDAHQHVICVRCRRIRDVEMPDVEKLLKGRAELGEFRVLSCSVEFHALCKDCEKKASRAGSHLSAH